MLDGPPLLFIEFFEIGGGHREHMEMEEEARSCESRPDSPSARRTSKERIGDRSGPTMAAAGASRFRSPA
jgi:hypothetical protein